MVAVKGEGKVFWVRQDEDFRPLSFQQKRISGEYSKVAKGVKGQDICCMTVPDKRTRDRGSPQLLLQSLFQPPAVNHRVQPTTYNPANRNREDGRGTSCFAITNSRSLRPSPSCSLIPQSRLGH